MARAAASTPTAPRPSFKLPQFTPGNAKEAMKEVAATTRQVYMVPVEHLTVAPGFNVRITDTPEYREGIEELKRNIQAQGFYSTKPLAGFVAKNKEGGNVVYVTDGHRRLDAAKLAAAEGTPDLEKLPVILKPASTTSLDLNLALDKENSGQQLTMLERAVLVKRALGSGLTPEEVADKFGITTRYVSDLMTLIAAPKQVRAMVSDGRIAGTLAVKELRAAEKSGADPVVKLTKLTASKEGRVKPSDANGSKSNLATKMATVVTRFSLLKGQTAPLGEIEKYRDLFPDSDWYSLTELEGEIKAEEDVTIEVKVTRPRKLVEIAPPGKPGRPRKKLAESYGVYRGEAGTTPEEEEDGEGVGTEVDPMTMQDDDKLDPADLRQLGIVDAADDL